jgi:hypothetical protein
VPADEVLQRRVVAACRKFWDSVVRRQPPSSNGHPVDRKILARHATEDSSLEVPHDDVADALDRYESNRARRLALSREADQLKRGEGAALNEIAARLGKHRAGHTLTGWVFEWQTQSRKAFTVEAKTVNQFNAKYTRKREIDV